MYPQLPVFPTGFLSRPKYTGRPGPPSQEFHKFRGQFFSRSSSSLSAQLPQPMPFLNFSFSILYKLRKISISLSLALNFFFWTFFFLCLREKSYGWISRVADWPTHLNDSSQQWLTPKNTEILNLQHGSAQKKFVQIQEKKGRFSSPCDVFWYKLYFFVSGRGPLLCFYLFFLLCFTVGWGYYGTFTFHPRYESRKWSRKILYI